PDAAHDLPGRSFADRCVRRARRVVRDQAGDHQQRADLTGAADQPRLGLCRGQRRRCADLYLRIRSGAHGYGRDRARRGLRTRCSRRGLSLLLAVTAIVFVGLIALSLPIVFALGTAAVVGLLIGGYPLEMVASSMIAG